MQPLQTSARLRASGARVLRLRHALAAILAGGCTVTLPAAERPPRPEEIPPEILESAERGGERGPERAERERARGPAGESTAGESTQSAPARIVGGLIPVETRLGHPSLVSRLTVEVETGALHQLPDAPNQRIVRRARADRELPRLGTGGLFPAGGAREHSFTLSDGPERVVVRAGPGARVRPDERRTALRAEGGIEARHPEVAALARRVTRGAASDRERATRLVRWVGRGIEYARADETRASAILAAGEGDCSEQARLFVALARAAGVPAREVAGLAYTERDGSPGFGYHAWADVALDGRWVPVDPTWSEPVADATHIRLSHGRSEAWKLAAGHVEIRIVAFRLRPGAPRLSEGSGVEQGARLGR